MGFVFPVPVILDSCCFLDLVGELLVVLGVQLVNHIALIGGQRLILFDLRNRGPGALAFDIVILAFFDHIQFLVLFSCSCGVVVCAGVLAEIAIIIVQIIEENVVVLIDWILCDLHELAINSVYLLIRLES